MVRTSTTILAVVISCVFSCTPAPEGEPEQVRLVAPYPPSLSEVSLQGDSQLVEEETGEVVEGKVSLPNPGKRSALKIPEPASAMKMMADYRGRVPQGHGAALSFAHIAPERTDVPVGSLSIGGASSGRLKRGKAMPLESPHHMVLQKTRSRNTIYGTDELVAALVGAAKYVAMNAPGAVLGVGNMSQPEGGDIPQSVSHNSGRDVDVSFYSLNDRNRPLKPEWYVEYDAQGFAEDGSSFRFDAGRNWLFIESLLMNRSIQVQYIFVADWLKDIMIEYGIRAGAHAEVIRRAEHVLMQPRDSSPHAEHFHIRLYCDLNDRLHGCHDAGKKHPWIESWDSAVEERVQRLIEAYQSGIQSERDAALRQLDLLRMQPEDESPESGEETL